MSIRVEAHDSVLAATYKESKELQIGKPTKDSVAKMQQLATAYKDRLGLLKPDPSKYSQVEKEELSEITNTAQMGFSLLNKSSKSENYGLLFSPIFWSKTSDTVGV